VGLAATGLALRLVDFARHDFWNDEAWVALSTRTEGIAQFWLSLAITPPLWAASLRPLALLPAAPEASLRVLPLVFGMLTLAAAYRVGTAFAGHAIGGVVALAVVAADPLSVAYSRELKHYTAETFFCLLAFSMLMRCARSERVGEVVGLALVLLVGMPFANSQLFVAPAALGALLASAAVRRAWPLAAAVGVATVAVGTLELLYFRLAVAPRLHASLTEYWEGAYIPDASLSAAARFVYESLAAQLTFRWGTAAAVVALLCLGAAMLRERGRRSAGLALALLVAELAILSSRRAVPFNEPRVTLFLLTTLGVLAAASVGLVARTAWARPVLRPLVALAMLAGMLAVARRSTALVPPHAAEDLGTLVRAMERERLPDDALLLYERSGYVYAYYRRQPPRLVPDAAVTVGFRPLLDDPTLVVVDGRTAEAAVERAIAGRTRVWLVGSRFRDDDEQRIRKALAARTVTLFEKRGARALLILAVRPAA
jgi:hypothetical protein